MNHSNNHVTELIKETLVLTAAMAIVAGAVYFFLLPSHASVSSISGLGIILSNFVPLPLSAITMILNILLLIIGFFTCGKEFGAKTVYTSIVLPLFLALFERIFPNIGSLTDSQELDVLCYVLTVSIGLSILFNRNASSGGLDIVAKIMNKYLHNVKRRVCIITKKEEELRHFIINDLHSGATIDESIGAYNMEKRNEIITIVDKSEYQKLMNYINREDPHAFITVYTVSDIRYQPKK